MPGKTEPLLINTHANRHISCVGRATRACMISLSNLQEESKIRATPWSNQRTHLQYPLHLNPLPATNSRTTRLRNAQNRLLMCWTWIVHHQKKDSYSHFEPWIRKRHVSHEPDLGMHTGKYEPNIVSNSFNKVPWSQKCPISCKERAFQKLGFLEEKKCGLFINPWALSSVLHSVKMHASNLAFQNAPHPKIVNKTRWTALSVTCFEINLKFNNLIK